MKKILVIGSANIDFTTYVSGFPQKGQTVKGNNFESNIGGKGLNQSFSAYYLGGDVTFIGSLGNDEQGNTIRDFCKKEGINAILKNSNVHTGIATIVVDEEKKDNIIIVVGGSNNDLKKEDIDLSLLKNSDIILMQMEIPIETIDYVLEKAKELNKITILNPAPATILTDKMLKGLDYIIPNETELNVIAIGNTLEEKCDNLLKKGVKNIIVTLGDKGSILINQKEKLVISPHKVKVVDTTAAGDSYIGTFVYELSKGTEIKNALNNASFISAKTVTRKGAIKSLEKSSSFKNNIIQK